MLLQTLCARDFDNDRPITFSHHEPENTFLPCPCLPCALIMLPPLKHVQTCLRSRSIDDLVPRVICTPSTTILGGSYRDWSTITEWHKHQQLNMGVQVHVRHHVF